MDTFSSSVSVIKVPKLHSTQHHRQSYNFKTPISTSQQLPPYSNSNTKPTSISNRSTTLQYLSHKPLLNPPHSTSHSSSPPFHQNPATGYATALVDVAQCTNSLQTVQRDVLRLAKLLQNDQIQALLIDPLEGEKQKAQIVNEVGKMGKFNRLLMRLLNMLLQRNKVTMVNEVLVEFQRIFDELSGTEVVLVPSKKKMKEDELLQVALRVQKISGAVNVKIRNLIDDNSPLFAL